MKDKIFIAWSGSVSVAKKVSERLRRENFFCRIGGNDNNDLQSISIGDTVVSQMKECNQAIVIFQNREDGQVSRNLFFELGYVFAVYGAEKVHCVKRKGEKIELPSDFDNAFVEDIDGESDEEFAGNILKYFIKRQKMTIIKNKMELINNRYNVREIIRCHYSRDGSKCSDYELAQYLLFYAQASHMFQDEEKVLNKLKEFNRDHAIEFSKELRTSVSFSIGYLEMALNLQKDGETGNIYISYETFDDFSLICDSALEQADDDDVGDFSIWLRTFVYETLNFAYMLIGENPCEEVKYRIENLRDAMKTADMALSMIGQLEANEIVRRNNDTNGILALFRSYVSRNQFVTLRALSELLGDPELEKESLKWLIEAKRIRNGMVTEFKGILDSGLYDNLCMEYYLISCECLRYAEDLIDRRERRSLLNGIGRYLESMNARKQASYVFIDQIQKFYDTLK